MKKLIFIFLCACNFSSAMEKVQQAQDPLPPYDSLFLFVKDQITMNKQKQLNVVIKENTNGLKKVTTRIVNTLLPNPEKRETAKWLVDQIDIIKSDFDCGNTAKAIAQYYFKGNINNPHQMDHNYTSLFAFVKSVLNSDSSQIKQRETLYQKILTKEEAIYKLVELALPDQENRQIAESLCTPKILEKDEYCAFITAAVGSHFGLLFIKEHADRENLLKNMKTRKTEIDNRIKELQTQSSTLNQKKKKLEEDRKQAIEDEKKRLWNLHLELMEKNGLTYDN